MYGRGVLRSGGSRAATLAGIAIAALGCASGGAAPVDEGPSQAGGEAPTVGEGRPPAASVASDSVMPRIAAPGSVERDRAPAPDGVLTPRRLFETRCVVCHSLELPRSQRLSREDWKWVVGDMVNKFGASWISKPEQAAIIDYLSRNYGPDRPREP